MLFNRCQATLFSRRGSMLLNGGGLGLVTNRERAPGERCFQVTGKVMKMEVVRRPVLRIWRWNIFTAEVYQVFVGLDKRQREGFDIFLGKDSRHHSLPSQVVAKTTKKRFKGLAVGEQVGIPYVHSSRERTIKQLPLKKLRQRGISQASRSSV